MIVVSSSIATVTVVSSTDVTVPLVKDNVAMDDDTTITYSNLTTVFVAVGDSVQPNTLLGKYQGTFSTTIAEGGEIVKQVVASETQLTWQA